MHADRYRCDALKMRDIPRGYLQPFSGKLRSVLVLGSTTLMRERATIVNESCLRTTFTILNDYQKLCPPNTWPHCVHSYYCC